jgi:hypothetical protein
VFLDVAEAGARSGKRSAPWRAAAPGHVASLEGNDLVIRTGNCPETVTLSKPVVNVTGGGPVTIGR